MTVITITHTHKPPRPATATATVKVQGNVPAFEIVRAGLAALHESPARLSDYGIEGHRGCGDLTTFKDTLVTVFAERN